MVGFFHSSPERQVLEHLTWGRERSGMQARPGSRLCDRVLSWAPKFRKADHRKMVGFFHSSPERQVLEHLTWGRERSGMQARPGSRLCDRVLCWHYNRRPVELLSGCNSKRPEQTPAALKNNQAQKSRNSAHVASAFFTLAVLSQVIQLSHPLHHHSNGR